MTWGAVKEKRKFDDAGSNFLKCKRPVDEKTLGQCLKLIKEPLLRVKPKTYSKYLPDVEAAAEQEGFQSM